MQHLLNTLYVMTPGAYIRLENDTIRVEVEQQKQLQVPSHHISSVVSIGETMISPLLMHYCADNGISMVLLDRNGRFKARLEGKVSGNILLRQAQHQVAGNKETSLAIARSIIAGKLCNSRQILLRGARETEIEEEQPVLKAAAETHARILKTLPMVTDIEVLRGMEGDAARHYFANFSYLIKPQFREDFALKDRNRRPPLDRPNAILSFLYTLLTHDCRSALESVGLDPQLGVLHVVRPGRPSLALDLMEEFRSIIADRIALALINRGQLAAKAFEIRPGGAVHMSDDARKTIITEYQTRKKEEVHHPLLDKKVPIGLLPFLQARFLARTIRGEMEGYLPFITR